MSSHEWREGYRMIRKMDRTLQPAKRRPVYSDVLIVAMYLWSVAHDRPQLWACDRQNYHPTWLPKLLPSQSHFNRRLRSPRMHVWHHDYAWPADRPYGVNFGIALSIWDWLFGTAWWPDADTAPRQQPTRLGFHGIENFPRGILARFTYPLSRLWTHRKN